MYASAIQKGMVVKEGPFHVQAARYVVAESPNLEVWGSMSCVWGAQTSWDFPCGTDIGDRLPAWQVTDLSGPVFSLKDRTSLTSIVRNIGKCCPLHFLICKMGIRKSNLYGY